MFLCFCCVFPCFFPFLAVSIVICNSSFVNSVGNKDVENVERKVLYRFVEECEQEQEQEQEKTGEVAASLAQ